MKNKRRITKTLMLSFFGELLNKAFPLLVLRHAERTLGLDGIGIAQTGINLIDMCIPLVTFGVATMAAIQIGQSNRTPEALGAIVTPLTLLKCINALVVTVVLLGIMQLVPKFESSWHVVLALLFVLFTTAIDMTYVHMGTQRLRSLTVLMTSVKIASLVAIYVFISSPQDIALFAVLSFGINGLISLATVALNAKLIKLRWPARSTMKRVFLQSAPFALVSFLLLLSERIDFLAVGYYLPHTAAGLYTGAMRIPQAIFPLVAAIANVFFSESVGESSRASLTSHARTALWLGVGLTLPIALGSFFIGQDILALLGESFTNGASVFSILTVQLILQVGLLIFGINVLLIRGKIREVIISLGCGCLVTFVITTLIGHKYGSLGIALSAVAGRTVAVASLIYVARAYIDSVWSRQLSRTLLAAGILLVVLVLTTSLLPLWQFIFGIMTYVIAMGLLNKAEMTEIIRQLRAGNIPA